MQIAEDIFHGGLAKEFETFSVTARQIWLRRNERIHDGTFTHPNELVLGVHRKIDNFHTINQKINGEAHQLEGNRWKASEAGWLKVNCDAALDQRGRRIGVGGILRDDKGSVRAT
jgi:hypothetical protein